MWKVGPERQFVDRFAGTGRTGGTGGTGGAPAVTDNAREAREWIAAWKAKRQA